MTAQQLEWLHFFALAASQRKTNKAARFRNLIRLWVPEQLKYYSWSASVNPPMESIYRWSLLYWWSVAGLFKIVFISYLWHSGLQTLECLHASVLWKGIGQWRLLKLQSFKGKLCTQKLFMASALLFIQFMAKRCNACHRFSNPSVIILGLNSNEKKWLKRNTSHLFYHSFFNLLAAVFAPRSV